MRGLIGLPHRGYPAKLTSGQGIIPNKCLPANHNMRWSMPSAVPIIPNKCLPAKTLF